MCGIVFAVGDIDQKAEKAFLNMLIFDVVRGEDSTGVVGVGKFQGAEVKVAKELGNPFYLFDTKSFDRLISRTHRALIGHNRYATTGAVNRRNAHPFEFDGVVGVHNGTLTNKWDLPNGKDFQVDSEALYSYINDAGLEKAIAGTTGAWALAFWDKYEETFNMIRNDERPLHFCYSEDGKQLFGASEAWMLTVALSRQGIKHGQVGMLKEDTHFKLPVGLGGKFGEVELCEVKSKVPVRVAPFPQGKGTVTSGPTTKKQNIKQLTVTPKPTQIHQAIDTAYLGATDVEFEALSVGQDEYGAEYIACFDVKHATRAVRLYFHANHSIQDVIGCTFKGNISGYTNHEGGYYKISPWSLHDVEAPINQMHVDHNGKLINAETWETLYGSCAFCSDDVPASDSKYVILSKQGQCLCKGCAADKEIAQFVH